MINEENDVASGQGKRLVKLNSVKSKHFLIYFLREIWM